MKKVLAVLLSVAMAVSMLAGCAGGAATETAAQTQAAETKAAETKAAETKAAAETTAAQAASAEHPGWLCDEKTTLTVLTYDGANNTFPAPSNELPFWQYMEDLTNVHIEWEVVPVNGYEEVIAARLAAGSDLPDIVNVRDFNAANNAGKNGLFINLNDYWDAQFTNTEKYFADQNVNYRGIVQNEDGTVYAMVSTVSPTEGHIIYCYNTLWLEKLGAKIPTTLDEFTALLEQMKAAGDLNGNGEADEVYFTSSNLDTLSSVMNNTFGLNAYEAWDQFAVKDGTVYPEYTCENEKAYFAYLNKLYKDGLLDPEIASMNADMLSEKVAADRVGVFVYYSAFAITYGSLTSAAQNDKFGEYYTLGRPLASQYNDNKGYFIRRDKANGDATCINVDCKNKELACKWLDTLFADPEVLITRTNGFEGEDYTLTADGKIELIQPADGSAWSIVNKGCGQITLPFIQTKEQLLNSKQMYKWYVAEYDVIRDECEFRKPQITQVTAYTDAEQEKIDEVRTDCKDYYNEMRSKFVTGASDVNAEWDTYVKNMEKLGLATWTEAWQSVYNRTK